MLGVATGESMQLAPRLRRRLRRLLIVLWFTSRCLAGLGLGAGLVWGGAVGYRLVRDAPYFRLQTVDVVGNRHLSRSDVRYLLAIPAQATIWQLDLRRMGARLERHPYVKSVVIRRLMPDTLTVAVEERVPYAVAVAGQQHMVLDSTGVVLGPSLPERDARLPRLKLRDRRALTPGMRLRQRDIRQALELIQAYSSSAATAGTRLVALTVEASGTAVAEVEPYAFAIRLREQALATQLERLPAVVQVIRERELAVQLVDLSYRKRVIIALSKS
jgi:cell division septal protein FtsQ